MRIYPAARGSGLCEDGSMKYGESAFDILYLVFAILSSMHLVFFLLYDRMMQKKDEQADGYQVCTIRRQRILV